eukprot:GAHX01002194.1.p1 GENE.GAHX01002194.1~~GAHX01002194.1.p1  ORF type:complete len:594 (+),score=105.19 GAHX01002194.1:28-1782(+)
MTDNIEREVVIKLLNCILYSKKIDPGSIDGIDSVYYRHYSNIVQKIADMLKLEAMILKYIKGTKSADGCCSPSRAALGEFYNKQIARLRAAISKTDDKGQETQSIIRFYFFLRPYYTEIIYLAKQVEIIKNATGGLISKLLRRAANTGSVIEVKFCEEAIRSVEIPIYNTLMLWINEGVLVSEGNEGNSEEHFKCDFFIQTDQDGQMILCEHLIPSSISYETAMVALKCGKLLGLLRDNFTQQEIQPIKNGGIVEVSVDLGRGDLHGRIQHRYEFVNKRMMELLHNVYNMAQIIDLTKNQLCFMDSSFSEALLSKLNTEQVLAQPKTGEVQQLKREFNALQEQGTGEYLELSKKVLRICHEHENGKLIFFFSFRKSPIIELLFTENDLKNLETISKLLVSVNKFCFVSRKFHEKFILPIKKGKLNYVQKFIIQNYNKVNFVYMSLFESLGVYKIELEFYKLKKQLSRCSDFFEMKELIGNAISDMKDNFTEGGSDAYWYILKNLGKTLAELEELCLTTIDDRNLDKERCTAIIESIGVISTVLDHLFYIYFESSSTMKHSSFDFLGSFLNFNEYFTNKQQNNVN